MKYLLSDNRLTNLLNSLNNTSTITVSTVASKLDVSERTVRNDVKQLNQMFKGCAFVCNPQGRLSLRVFQPERFQEVLSELEQKDTVLNSFRGRLDYIFGRLMRSETPLITDDLAHEVFVGRTTLIGSLNMLRQELEPYHVHVVGKISKGLMLSGDEIAIRSYVLDVNYDSIYRDYQIDPKIKAAIDRAFENGSLEQKVRHRFQQFLTLMLDRFLTGHPIETLSDAYYSLATKPEFKLINDLLIEIGHIVQVTFPIEEQIFALLPIIGMQTPTDVEKLGLIELDGEIDLLLSMILNRIKQKMNLSIELEKFRKEFLYHLMFMINRLRFKINLQTSALEDLVEKYPLAMQITDIAAEVIEEKFALVVTKHERTYLAAYFSVFLEENQHEKIPFRIAIVCSTGRVTARLIAAQLRKILDSTTSLEFFSDEEIRTEILDTFDIVLTTVNISCPCSRPIIRISEIFDEHKLRQKIEKARYWDQIGIPALNNNWFITTGLLNESRFFVLDKANDYEAAVAHMVQHLIATNQLDKDFAERLARREQKGTMVFDHSVAIPHEIQFVSDQLLVAIGVLPQALHYKGHDIRIIFLLGLPEKIDHNDSLLIRVYDELIRIAQNQKLLNELASSSSYEDFLQTFYWQPHQEM